MIGNRFLESLETDDYDAVSAILRPVRIGVGSRLIEHGARVEWVHFPTTALLSNITLADNGEQLQTAVIGNEGMSGLVPFLADAACEWHVECSVAGHAYFSPAAGLRRLSNERPSFRLRLLALTHFYQAQANQLALCNTLHSVDKRIARWILTMADRTGSTRLVFTQDQIAKDLGVQRTSIVAGFQIIKKAGALRRGRAWLEIVDRPALLQQSCSCYSRIAALAETMGFGSSLARQTAK